MKLHIYAAAGVVGSGLAGHICHAQAQAWDLAQGCLVVTDGAGVHWYPLTSVARFTIERPR